MKKRAESPKANARALALMSEKSKKFDPKASAEDCILDLRRVQEKHPFKFICRNFYRIHGKFSDATWNQHFGTFHEFRRQAKLELSRDQHALEKKIAKHASLDAHRKFYEEEVLPYHRKYDRTAKQKGRYRSIAVASDFHDLDVDRFLLAIFIDFCHRTQPDIIVLNGDVFDNPEFSRYDIDPRDFKIKERFDFVKEQIFAPLRKACPKAQIDLVIGNHEWRILKLISEKTPNLKVLLSDVMGLSLSDVFGLDEFQINLVAKLDLAAFRDTDVKELLSENYAVYYGIFACSHFENLGLGVSGTNGHTHKPTQRTFVNVPMGKCSWTTTGCMAKTREHYTEGHDRNVNSFLSVLIDLENRSAVPTHYIIPGDAAVIEGKLYERSDFED